MPKYHSKLLRWMFPVFNVEISACISIVALYMFLSEGGHAGSWDYLNEAWRGKDYFTIIEIAALLIFGVILLLMPWVSLARGRQLRLRGLKAGILMTALVLICSYGWIASLYQVKYHHYQSEYVFNHYLLLGIVAFAEFIFFTYGTFKIIGMDSDELRDFVQGEKVDKLLFGFNLLATGLILSVERFTLVLENPDASLLLINVFFVASRLRKRKVNIPAG